MTNEDLIELRRIADLMAGPEPQNWEWIGENNSHRMFGITEHCAKVYAKRHGGTATKERTTWKA